MRDSFKVSLEKRTMKYVVSTSMFILLLGLSFGSIASEGGNAEAGKTKSATCSACHGMDGNSMNPEWPTLAGQHPKYIAKQLANFKSGDRYNATMSPMAEPLSEQDMADLAAYYSGQKAKGGMADESKVALGEEVFRGGNTSTGVPACAGCHSPTGFGNPAAKFPRLAGQHAKYTAIQLYAFRKGERGNDAGKMMRNIALRMTDDEIEAVAEFIQGLK